MTDYIKTVLLFLLLPHLSYADDVLTHITARLIKTPITQGDFQQEKRLKILRKPLMSTGTFTYHQSKGVIWKTLTPIPSVLMINESKLLTGQGEQAVPAAFGNVFKALLGGELNRLAEGFDMTGTEQKMSWQLQLKPKDELLRKIISTILISGDTELRSLEIQEVTGNQTQISFTQINHPDHLSDEQQADFEHISP
jgi:Outer membrane lipoprotein carrier protein LolA